MKPMCEKVIPSNNSSWRYCEYRLNTIPFNWHYHPEYEICLTLNSTGVCHIGDYLSPFGDLDLVILGPDLPHTWQSNINPDGSSQIVHVAQIPAQWLHQFVNGHPEFSLLRPLLSNAKQGIKFANDTAVIAKRLFEKIKVSEPLTRYILLIELLQTMALDTDAKILSTSIFISGQQRDPGKNKFDKVIDFIYNNYTKSLCADELADLAHMSTNHFHRFFKKRTERTLTEFINQLRIAKACKLLISSSSPITVISDQCGFRNISNFNRRFLQIKGCTPSRFRQQIHKKSLLV